MGDASSDFWIREATDRKGLLIEWGAFDDTSCDLTRVAAVQFGHHQSTQVNLPEVGAPGDWHNGFMHSDNPRSRLVNIERWLAGQFVAAANKLKETPAPDGNGSLFDQTLMLWARDMGDAVVHSGADMRFALSGGAGGYLRTGGSYIDGGGQAHSKVLFNVLEAMGISDPSGLGNDMTDRDPIRYRAKTAFNARRTEMKVPVKPAFGVAAGTLYGEDPREG